MNQLRWKFLRTGLKSEYGGFKWKKGQWETCNETLNICHVGFHCSKGIYQAFSYVQGELLAEVEVKGKHLTGTDKECWEKMRIVRVYRWKKIDSVLFAIYAARLVLKLYEDKYPNDDRPRKAIEAAENYAKYPTAKNRVTANAANYANATNYAAYSAYYTANAANYAANSANYAANAAAKQSIYKKLDKWMLDHLKELEEVK